MLIHFCRRIREQSFVTVTATSVLLSSNSFVLPKF
jgi:hypothetical protein